MGALVHRGAHKRTTTLYLNNWCVELILSANLLLLWRRFKVLGAFVLSLTQLQGLEVDAP